MVSSLQESMQGGGGGGTLRTFKLQGHLDLYFWTIFPGPYNVNSNKVSIIQIPTYNRHNNSFKTLQGLEISGLEVRGRGNTWF